MLGMLELVFVFFYIGLFSIGGGLAALPFVQQEAVNRGWVTLEEFFSMVAISESTPGPIGINLATYVGNMKYGALGGVLATLGNVLPSLIIIVIIAKYFQKFGDEPVVKAAFYGLRAAVVGLISVAFFDVLRVAIFHVENGISANLTQWIDFKAAALFVVIYLVKEKLKLHPLVVIAIGAVSGILVF